MDDVNEAWRPIPGYESRYMASSMGRILSLPSLGLCGGGLLTLTVNVQGYPYVNLLRDGEQKSYTVHKLVTLAFLGPRPEGLQVRHMNGDKLDSRLENLQYGTPSENARDQRRHGTDPRLRKTRCPQGHPYTADNTVLNPAGARCCRTCRRDRSRANSAKLKAQKLAAI